MGLFVIKTYLIINLIIFILYKNIGIILYKKDWLNFISFDPGLYLFLDGGNKISYLWHLLGAAVKVWRKWGCAAQQIQ